MSADILVALLVFALVSTITPGPNNLMLLASGMNFGLRRSLPHMAGVVLGLVAMVLLLGIGVAQGLARLPQAMLALKAASVLYMLWLAWKIATAAAPGTRGAPGGRPLTFLQAAAFQWVNPKAWAMALTALGVYAMGETPGVAIVAAAFLLVGPPCNLLWIAAGERLRRLVANPAALRRVNVAMAALLVLSLWPVLRA